MPVESFVAKQTTGTLCAIFSLPQAPYAHDDVLDGYRLMVFADKRYNSIDKRGKLPSWITDHLPPENMQVYDGSSINGVSCSVSRVLIVCSAAYSSTLTRQ